MAKYFITGATGTIGQEVIHALLAKGEQVIAGVRNLEKSKQLFGDAVEHAHFDFQHADTYKIVTQGVDGVFLLGPPLYLELYELLTPFVDYLTQHGPKRVVYLSASGMEKYEFLNFHQRMEQKLAATNLDWRVVRPGYFMQNFGNYERENIELRKMLFTPAGEGKTAFISAKDIGAAIAVLLTDDQYSKQDFDLTGKELFSYSEVAALLSEILGETITYPAPDSTTYKNVLVDSGAPAFIADYMIAVYSLIQDGEAANVNSNIEKLTGQQPESLKIVLERDFA